MTRSRIYAAANVAGIAALTLLLGGGIYQSLASNGRRLLEYFPRLKRNPARPLDRFTPCSPSVIAETLKDFQPSLHDLFDSGVNRDQLDAFRRITRKAQAAARHVYYVKMPQLPRIERYSADEFPVAPQVEGILGERWIRLSMEDWGLSAADWFGSMEDPTCELDGSHLNTAASPRLTRKLADIIRQDLQPR